MQTHVKVLAWLFIIFGAFYLIGAFGVQMFVGIITAIIGAEGGQDAALGATIFGLTGTAISVFLVCMGIPGIITGIGLLKLKRWARIAGIILSAMRLISFPIGTALGVYGLWVFFDKDTEALVNQ